jgi:hypothetical protein
MEVVLKNGDKMIGRLGQVTSDGFTLNPDNKQAGTPRYIQFAEVRSVKTKWTTAEKWLFGGVIYAGITALMAATVGY